MIERIGWATALGLLAWACSQAPRPEVLGAGATEEEAAATTAGAAEEPATGAQEPAEAADQPSDGGDEAETAAAPGEPAAEPAGEASPERDDATVILIERGEETREPRPTTLYEAATAARAKRSQAPRARVSVTDENLHEFQGEGVTILTAEPGSGDEGSGTGAGEAGTGAGGAGGPATGAPGEPSKGVAGAHASGADVEPARGEAYWRTRMRDLRLGLREAVDELAELERRAGSLRRSFYAADDPYVRDAEIKPAWDRVLDRIAETREAIAGLRAELAEALDEGRTAGALPGWLREGIDLEPEEDEYPRDPERYHQPGEPEILEIREPPGR